MRAYSVKNVLDAKFETLDFEGKWKDAIGCPELAGSWIIYGPPKNGKTSFAMMMAKYMTKFGRVFYNSIEEGLSKSTQMAYERVGMIEVSGKIILKNETIDEMTERLNRHKSPDIVFFDSIQFAELKFSDYKRMKTVFPNKLFVYVSHVEGKQPEGQTARKIWKDANVSFRVEGFRAFPTGRYGGGQYINISDEKAMKYWITE
ncbi:MAG: AAA family ATPase [Dysgonamonadaceae bacterium]|jgi:hypothetical protein|nr:AAA family ATPase [Dysgonamonadaceae bacterium]